MSKINKYDDFINEGLSLNSFKSLLNKVKAMVSKKQIDNFIENNKTEIKRVHDLLVKDGEVDYKKAFNFVKENLKKNG